MRLLLILAVAFVTGCSSVSYATSPMDAVLLKKVQVCEKVQIPIYGMIERPASDAEVFTGMLIGGVIGNQFGSGSGNDAMTFIGALMGAESGSERKRQRVIIDYREVTQCWEEWQ